MLWWAVWHVLGKRKSLSAWEFDLFHCNWIQSWAQSAGVSLWVLEMAGKWRVVNTRLYRRSVRRAPRTRGMVVKYETSREMTRQLGLDDQKLSFASFNEVDQKSTGLLSLLSWVLKRLYLTWYELALAPILYSNPGQGRVKNVGEHTRLTNFWEAVFWSAVNV